MASRRQMTLTDYMNLEYPVNVIADPDGGYVAIFPDLPGCMTQAEDLTELVEMAEDARRLWIEVALEDGDNIPPPTYPETYSGRFNVRIPKSLHRRLVEDAKSEGVSLNQHVVSLLATSSQQTKIEKCFKTIESQLAELDNNIRNQQHGSYSEDGTSRSPITPVTSN